MNQYVSSSLNLPLNELQHRKDELLQLLLVVTAMPFPPSNVKLVIRENLLMIVSKDIGKLRFFLATRTAPDVICTVYHCCDLFFSEQLQVPGDPFPSNINAATFRRPVNDIHWVEPSSFINLVWVNT